MRYLGVVMLALGFFGAAFVTVWHGDSAGLEWHTVEWGWYVLPFVVGVLGVLVLRGTARATETHAHKLDADLATMQTSLGSVVAKLQKQCANRQGMHVYDVHDWIDDELVGELGDFVEARESLIPLYGLRAYASIMSDFAQGERYINRAWSASADGYIDEVWICVDRAVAQLKKAQALLAEQIERQDSGTALVDA